MIAEFMIILFTVWACDKFLFEWVSITKKIVVYKLMQNYSSFKHFFETEKNSRKNCMFQ